ncbi:hypothetical protein, partial [Alkalicoccus saliphilus]
LRRLFSILERKVAPTSAFDGSLVRKEWLKTQHKWLFPSAILRQHSALSWRSFCLEGGARLLNGRKAVLNLHE